VTKSKNNKSGVLLIMKTLLTTAICLLGTCSLYCTEESSEKPTDQTVKNSFVQLINDDSSEEVAQDTSDAVVEPAVEPTQDESEEGSSEQTQEEE
jgi:hypothetical protein